MTSPQGQVRVVLELGHTPSGEPAAHVRRVDVPTDFGTVWLVELPVLLESLLLQQHADEADAGTGTSEGPAPQEDPGSAPAR